MGIGPLEIGIVLVILLVVFGPKKLPGLGRGLGSGMREFKEGIQGGDADSAKQQQLPETPVDATPDASSATPESAARADAAPPRTTQE